MPPVPGTKPIRSRDTPVRPHPFAHRFIFAHNRTNRFMHEAVFHNPGKSLPEASGNTAVRVSNDSRKIATTGLPIIRKSRPDGKAGPVIPPYTANGIIASCNAVKGVHWVLMSVPPRFGCAPTIRYGISVTGISQAVHKVVKQMRHHAKQAP